MKGWLRRVRVRLAAKNMVVSRDTEFMHGRSKACLRVWTGAHPEYEGHLTQQVRDLGGCGRGYSWKSHLAEAWFQVLGVVAARVGKLPVGRKPTGKSGAGCQFRGRSPMGLS